MPLMKRTFLMLHARNTLWKDALRIDSGLVCTCRQSSITQVDKMDAVQWSDASNTCDDREQMALWSPAFLHSWGMQKWRPVCTSTSCITFVTLFKLLHRWFPAVGSLFVSDSLSAASSNFRVFWFVDLEARSWSFQPIHSPACCAAWCSSSDTQHPQLQLPDSDPKLAAFQARQAGLAFAPCSSPQASICQLVAPSFADCFSGYMSMFSVPGPPGSCLMQVQYLMEALQASAAGHKRSRIGLFGGHQAANYAEPRQDVSRILGRMPKVKLRQDKRQFVTSTLWLRRALVSKQDLTQSGMDIAHLLEQDQ